MPCPKNILLVDDDSDDVLFFTIALKQVCPESNLIALSNGEDLVDYMEHLHNLPPDLLILDAHLPGLDGYQLLSHIRSHSRYNAIPVAISTSKKSIYTKEEAKIKGANHYMPKPRTLEHLAGQIIVLFAGLDN